MKIIHLADSHLGFSAYNKVDSKGRNQREENIYGDFMKAVERIIEERPDAVVHAGDVFHHVRPRIRPLLIFKRALDRLRDEGIPVVIISGNHDSPKSQATTSPFTLYEGMRDVYIARRYRYEKFEVGDYNFHCIPFCQNIDDYKKRFEEIRPSENDVLVMHGLIESIRDKRLNTVGEHELSESFLRKDFKYIALGHYHGQTQIANNAWYSGSIEYFRFSDINDKKGMLSIDLDKDPMEPQSICIDEIALIKEYIIDCEKLSSEEIWNEISAKCNIENVKNNIVRVKLKNVSRSAFRHINVAQINKIRSEALHFELFPEYFGEAIVKTGETIDANRLPEEFERFISDEIMRDRVPKIIQRDVKSYGRELIQNIIQKHTTEVLDASN
jgi:exonuclease SbcD